MWFSAPTDSDVAMGAQHCVASSKWIGITSPLQRSRHLPMTASSIDPTVIKAIKDFGIDPAKPNPLTV